MKSLTTILNKARILPELTDLLNSDQECSLVGGALRDWLLGKEPADFDFATPFDPTDLAKHFARKISGKWFFLDEERRQSRVVVDAGEGTVTYDFAPFRGPNLQTDQTRRDFTINTIALSLADGDKMNIFDPLGGRDDLNNRLIRACSAVCLEDDPLRILKGVRHAVTLGFQIEPETGHWMRSLALRLQDSAPERRRNELARILETRPVSTAFSLLQSLGLLPSLLGPSGSKNSCEEGIALALKLESWSLHLEAHDGAGLAGRLLHQELDDGFSRLGLMMLGAFLRGYDSVDLKGLLANRLRMSRENASRISALVALEAEKTVELRGIVCGRRGRGLWVQSLGHHPIECLIFLGVLVLTLREDLARVIGALEDYMEFQEDGRIPDLVTGGWLRNTLGLPQGPLIGEILDRVRLEEVAGRVQTLEDAREFAKSVAKKMVDKGRAGSL
jgi:poly(A) polymerase